MNELKYIYNYSNIILTVLVLLILGLYTYVRTRINISNHNYEKTINYVKYNFKYLISVFAKIRAGKTSTVNGLVHIKERELRDKCSSELVSIIDLLHSVDFNKVNNIIDSICDDDHIFYSNWDNITIRIFAELGIHDGVINDFINCKSIYEVIHKYIEDYYVINYRGVYVYSKSWRYSFVEYVNNKYLSDSTLYIKDTIHTKDFYLRNWSIVLEDELSLNRSNLLSNSREAKDTGKKELKALWGQIFEETVVYFSIKQRYEDEISSDRRLYTNYLSIENRRVTNDCSLFLKWYNFRKRMTIILSKLKFDLLKSINYKKLEIYDCYEKFYLSDDSNIRNKLMKFNNAIGFIKSLAWVVVDVIDYDREEDISNRISGKSVKLTMPLRETIGNYNTHDYKFIYDMLTNMSDVIVPKENSYFKDNDTKLKMGNFLFDHEDKRSGF